MTIDEAIRHCEEVAEINERICATELSVGLPDIYRHKDEAKKCADEHRQLAEWLKELKAYRDARAELNQALYDDARGEQNDYERGRKSGIFLCESIISVKLGESSSEIPNTCDDAISRQAAIKAIEALQRPIMREESNYYQFKFSGMSEAREAVVNLPSVTPQQRTGRWIDSHIPESTLCECSECGFTCGAYSFNYCPDCGCSMKGELE